MPQLPVKPFKRKDNVSILNAIRNESSSDYQRRVPEATKANLTETFRSIWDYVPNRNEFISSFINRIGRTVAHNFSYTNKLKNQKMGAIANGDTIEEYATGLITAQEYDPTRHYGDADVWGQAAPQVKVAFHSVNRQHSYKITINESMLQRAFDEPSGLHSFITQAMQIPASSDEVDEYILMSSLFRQYYDANGFFTQRVPDLQSPAASHDVKKANAAEFLETIKAAAETLTFPSTHYNAAKMPMVVQPEELVLYVTPKVKASMDVNGLAPIFHLDKADIPFRIQTIRPEDFRIPGVQAILTTDKFFVVGDTFFETASIQNPAGRYWNHWLHHDQIISASPFAPAILFSSTDAETIIEIDDEPVVGVTDLSAYDWNGVATTEAKRGELVQIIGSAITDPAGGLANAVRLTLVGALDPETRLDNTGALEVSLYEKAESLTVIATSTEDPTFLKQIILTVTGDRIERVGLKQTVVDDE